MNKFVLLSALALLGVSGCANVSLFTEQDSTPIVVSPSDDRAYQVLTLANEIEVILVSDPQLKKSAAALSVGVGSIQDPMSQQGLAHFLEHMLFLGTERYPDTKGYSEFMTKHGGAHNAYTGLDITNYMFQINNDAYDQALDRFSDFFKSPKLYPEYVEKEKNAVNAEWSMSRENDYAGQFKLSRNILGDHPANRFSTGNLETLSNKSGSKLHQEMVDFYNKYYSSNIMKVAMVSNLPLAEMARLAKQHFSGIKNKHIEKPKVTKTINLQQAGGKQIYYQSNEDVRQLVLDFTIRNNQADFASKPNKFVTYLLGSEMPGTPGQLLKSKGWVSSFYAGSYPSSYGNYGSLSVNIELTQAGMKNRDKIVAIVMQYIDLVKQQGVNEKYFQEIKTSLDNEFRFLEKFDDFMYAAFLAEDMQNYPLQNVINAPYYYKTFDENAIESVLNQLTPETLNVWYISKNEKTDKQLHFYNGKYRIENISAETIAGWYDSTNMKLSLPSVNRMLPETFAIKKVSKNNKPELVVDNKGIKVWYLPSQAFKEQPKGSIDVYFNSSLAQNNIKSTILLSIWSDLFQLQQAELIEEANTAGMQVFVHPEAGGLLLSISGFTDKQKDLLSKALQNIQVEVDEQRFLQAVDRLTREVENEKKQLSVSQAFNAFGQLITKDSWDKQAYLQVASKLTSKDLQSFIKQLLSQNQVRVFAFGNYDSQDINEMAAKLKRLLPDNHKITEYTRSKSWEPKEGQLFVVKKDIEVNDVAIIDLQSHSEPGLKQQARARVLIDHFANYVFDKLRTEEQLAYAVGAIAPTIDEYASVGLYIQTPVKGPKAIQLRLDQLKLEYQQELNKLPEAAFKQLKTSALVALKEKPKNLSDEVSPFISDWYDENYQFNTKAQLIAEIEKVTLDDIKRFYAETMGNPKAPRLNIQMRGKKFANQPFASFKNQTEVKSLSTFHQMISYQ
ncbi:insulinase family protein [Spartinivicinus poritis]|uniref:Protease 3 n=1 Tax=Spartinivicinus poritis TaxID=2994640 RepID=A0ABT5UCJ4_9GAMM|nr:insulinase family protein [Spartinivicinus sp. A2-2]MDE1463920.1 insulinase family protein [Spartinivicinus sp. A2-2]